MCVIVSFWRKIRIKSITNHLPIALAICIDTNLLLNLLHPVYCHIIIQIININTHTHTHTHVQFRK